MKLGSSWSLFCVIFGFFVSLPSSYAIQKPPIFLKIGEQRLLTLPPFDRYSVSGNAIRFTRILKENQLLIKGVSAGMSTLLTTEKQNTSSQTIRVEAKVESPYSHGLYQALNLLDSTETIDGGSQFILRGAVSNIREASSIAHIKKHFTQWIIDETTIEEHWLKQSAQHIKDILKSYPQLKLITTEGGILIQGAVSHEFTSQALMKKIQAIQPLTEFEIQTTKGFSPTLYFKVFLLEVKKEFTSKLGIEIKQPITGKLNFSPMDTITGNAVDFSIQAMTGKGLVKVLSAPELVVKSPGQAELFAGGEMPIRQKTRMEDKVAWKNVGLSLKLDVKEYDGERVRLSIETELNHINTALTYNEVPGIKTNRIKTQVEGTMGKPLLLSGLLQEDTREKISGLPGLSEIPLLGKLFSSEDFQKDRSELVAILLPYREPPKEPMQRVSSDIPKGYLPLSRNHLSSEDQEKIQSSREYPWNAL